MAAAPVPHWASWEEIAERRMAAAPAPIGRRALTAVEMERAVRVMELLHEIELEEQEKSQRFDRFVLSLIMCSTFGISIALFIWASIPSYMHSQKAVADDDMEMQLNWSSGLTGMGEAEHEACRQTLPDSDDLESLRTSESDPEPKEIWSDILAGERVLRPSHNGMKYQLFLPAGWSREQDKSGQMWPVVVYLHGVGDGKFSVMNSQSLPRLLARNQSTCFDPRSCWCLDTEFEKVTAKREAPPGSHQAFLDEDEDLRSPLADCDFADTFKSIVVMPQGWLPEAMTGWTHKMFDTVHDITQTVVRYYNGDATRVSLTGQSAGGFGAWAFAAARPDLWSSVSVVCAPLPSLSLVEKLEGVNIWVVGGTAEGEWGNDETVEQLKKRRKTGAVRYTRYVQAPAPPDPLYRAMAGQASYDLIYRDPRFWDWTVNQVNNGGWDAWQLDHWTRHVGHSSHYRAR